MGKETGGEGVGRAKREEEAVGEEVPLEGKEVERKRLEQMKEEYEEARSKWRNKRRKKSY